MSLPGVIRTFPHAVIAVLLVSSIAVLWCPAERPATNPPTIPGAGSGPCQGDSDGPRDAGLVEPSSDQNAPLATMELTAARARRPSAPAADRMVRLCQALGPAAPYPICGVDCWQSQGCCGPTACCPPAGCLGACGARPCGWEAARLINWQNYAQGEYCGPARTRHVDEYRLRVDDQLDLVYRLTREEQPNPYLLNVGDEIQVESATDPDLDRNLLIQPDGTITLRLLGQVKATGRTVPRLREEIEELYKKYYKVPAITVSPLRVNSKLDDLRNAVDARFGRGGQVFAVRVTPEGTISLPAIGVVQAQGLTLQELQVELSEAYRKDIEGIEVIPVLVARAPRYVYVLGEVHTPGRYELTGPTTVLQSIAMAGSWRVGAHLRQVVVLRRGEDWRLMATMLNLRAPLYGHQPCPPDEIWLSDSDVVIVPKNPILVADDFIELAFTRGIYGVFPMNATLNFSKLSTL